MFLYGLLHLEATHFLSFGRGPSSPPSRCRSGSYGTTLFRQIWVMHRNECLCLTTLVAFLEVYLRFPSFVVWDLPKKMKLSCSSETFRVCDNFYEDKHLSWFGACYFCSMMMIWFFIRECSYDSASVWAWHFLMQPTEAGELGLGFCWLPKLSGYVVIFWVVVFVYCERETFSCVH
ncbi:hypothetical protein HanXRQr2_Chr06g0247331 [Helianthus annuus]|uniref:Uncharacterized protein n=1 Tax=Helianthus annuus TaxID=4232 RepID=A0A9K3NJ23_HELAN|nr:hypothetical protein HanXRQr2_Chr06g0247331 [Helianthus annuus]KAJ0565749.1 hypothetical protein HanIR_Chr06g0266081 [Helianthus annuus]KAJ0572659.1 hypothetical protein HanHA89_Chr06g0218151 [Helianthus annuus]KAJ0737104.1 hypothetical protein HanLR1_Chr06g0203271 [Helianthus annuus]